MIDLFVFWGLAFETFDQLSEGDKNLLRRETTHRWDQPKTLFALSILCSLAAAVQGVRRLSFFRQIRS